MIDANVVGPEIASPTATTCRWNGDAHWTTTMPTILVVDDDDAIRRLMEASLAELGEVVSVADGEAALAATDRDVPDLVVLDIGLPDMSGLDLLRRWHADQRTADLEVIVLSGRHSATDQAAGHEAGASAYMAKPVDIDMLESFAAAMLADREQRQQELLDEFRALQLGDFSL